MLKDIREGCVKMALFRHIHIIHVCNLTNSKFLSCRNLLLILFLEFGFRGDATSDIFLSLIILGSFFESF